jgi:hypothetical protein
MLSKLDEAISKYASVLLRRGFAATAQDENVGYGYAERVFVLDHVLLKAIYLRGLTYLELGCSREPGRLVEASGFRDLMDPPAQGRWNLGMGAAAFLNAHWERVYDLLRPSNWMQTRQKIEALQRPPGSAD